jgi:ribosome-associated protein
MKIDTPYIKLDSLMKAVNVASSGGEAKFFITEGKVLVNGETERMEIGGKVFVVE